MPKVRHGQVVEPQVETTETHDAPQAMRGVMAIPILMEAEPTVRSSMATLISRWRRMVDDTGKAVWTDLQAQEILDLRRTDVFGLALSPVEQYIDGDYETLVYAIGLTDLEEADSDDDTVWRLYDGDGADVTPTSIDYAAGLIRFSTDQEGAALYLDCRSYDLRAAAADAWRERAAGRASGYDFGADGAQYSRSQWFRHCMEMAAFYDGQRTGKMTVLARSDLA